MASLQRFVARLNKSTREANKAFTKMSYDRKRVAIARDVLFQIKKETFIPTIGAWMNAELPAYVPAEAQEKFCKLEMQQILPKLEKCEGCGIGGVLYSTIRLHNQLPVEQAGEIYEETISVDQKKAFNYLSQFFDRKQLWMIEAAFEQRGHKPGGTFGLEIGDATERLQFIMENIVVNHGKFVPSKKPQWDEEKEIYFTPGFRG